jgi:hypothetical protein
MTPHKRLDTPRIGQIVIIPCTPHERDGCIWHWQLNPARIVESPVRVVSGKPRSPTQVLWDEHFLDTADVFEAISSGTADEVKQLIRSQLDDPNLSERACKNPASYVGANLASGLTGAKFVVWWRDSEQRLDVGIFCPNPRAASYAQLLAHGTDPFPVGKCNECGRRFVRDQWHPQRYCSRRCRNTHNVRVSRGRKRGRNKSRKHGVRRSKR